MNQIKKYWKKYLNYNKMGLLFKKKTYIYMS